MNWWELFFLLWFRSSQHIHEHTPARPKTEKTDIWCGLSVPPVVLWASPSVNTKYCNFFQTSLKKLPCASVRKQDPSLSLRFLPALFELLQLPFANHVKSVASTSWTIKSSFLPFPLPNKKKSKKNGYLLSELSIFALSSRDAIKMSFLVVLFPVHCSNLRRVPPEDHFSHLSCAQSQDRLWMILSGNLLFSAGAPLPKNQLWLLLRCLLHVLLKTGLGHAKNTDVVNPGDPLRAPAGWRHCYECPSESCCMYSGNPLRVLFGSRLQELP